MGQMMLGYDNTGTCVNCSGKKFRIEHGDRYETGIIHRKALIKIIMVFQDMIGREVFLKITMIFLRHIYHTWKKNQEY